MAVREGMHSNKTGDKCGNGALKGDSARFDVCLDITSGIHEHSKILEGSCCSQLLTVNGDALPGAIDIDRLFLIVSCPIGCGMK